MLTAEKLTFSYGQKQILHDIDFHAEKSQVIALIGANGSGKSTLLRCLAGLLRTASPSVSIDEKPVEKYKTQDLAKKIAFLPQSQERLPGITVHELVSMGRAPYHNAGWIRTREDIDKVNWAMNYMGIASMKNRMVNTLSGGERQRAWIAMILAQDTSIILLDEPVTYLDMKHQWHLLRTINDLKENHNKTIVSVFHDVNHALETSDKIYMIKEGAVYSFGGTDEIVTEESIKKVYEVNAYVCNFQRCCQKVVVPESIKRNCKHNS